MSEEETVVVYEIWSLDEKTGEYTVEWKTSDGTVLTAHPVRGGNVGKLKGIAGIDDD